MFKLFLKGDLVPREMLSFQRISSESVLPTRIEFLRSVLVTKSGGVFHVRPIVGIKQVNSIYINEMGGCIVKGGENGIVIHNVPLINLYSAIVVLSFFLALFHV